MLKLRGRAVRFRGVPTLLKGVVSVQRLVARSRSVSSGLDVVHKALVALGGPNIYKLFRMTIRDLLVGGMPLGAFVSIGGRGHFRAMEYRQYSDLSYVGI